MDKTVILEAKDVSIELGGKSVLKNVNLKIYDQESIVLIGPSGSGKTVLLKLLAGIYKPTTGHVFIEGEDWQNLENEEKHDLARKVGMMFQQSALFDTLTTLENVEFPIKEHCDYPEDEVIHISKDILAKVNLSDSLDKLPAELSGGMQKRLGIARALVLNPKVVFYDDPVAGQDPIQADQVTTLMHEFKIKNKSTLIISSSNMRIAFKMADRILMLVDDEIIDTGSPEETKNHPDPRVQQFIHGYTEGPLKVN